MKVCLLDLLHKLLLALVTPSVEVNELVLSQEVYLTTFPHFNSAIL